MNKYNLISSSAQSILHTKVCVGGWSAAYVRNRCVGVLINELLFYFAWGKILRVRVRNTIFMNEFAGYWKNNEIYKYINVIVNRRLWKFGEKMYIFCVYFGSYKAMFIRRYQLSKDYIISNEEKLINTKSEVQHVLFV